MAGNLKLVWIFVAVITVSILGGYFIGSLKTPKNSILKPAQQTPAEQEAAKNFNTFFSTQTAIVDGVIVSSDEVSVTIKNNKNETRVYPIVKNVLTIYDYDDKNKQATSSSSLKRIIVNKHALIKLGLIDNKYQVVSITYLSATVKP